jgi:hypothetical protein
MKTVGIICSALALMAAVFYTWLIYIVTFEEPNSKYMFETEPKEGYAYWMKIEFWEDFRHFSLVTTIAMVGAALPILALVRTGVRTWLDTVLVCLSLVYVGLSGTMLFAAGSNFAHFTQLAPVGMFLGACYAIAALLRRAKHPRIHEQSIV